MTDDKHPQLLPDRYPQYELFICDVADAILKSDMASMEHPFYSLSKKPDTKIRRYEHNGNWLEVVPSVKGLATTYDKDILIYCISQIMAKLKRGEKVSRRVRINSHDLLIFTNRGTAGKDYKALSEALDRLAGTRISTNIRVSNDEQEYNNIGLINAATIRRQNGLDGRMVWCEVEISDWVFDAIRKQDVLTLHRDYFRLRKPLERRIYEIARKHCGLQNSWEISLELLLKKSGACSPVPRFRQMVKNIAKHNHLPDYAVAYNAEKDMVRFTNKGTMAQLSEHDEHHIRLKLETYEKAKRAAPGYDIYFLENAWRHHWAKSGKPRFKNADAAFIGFCKKRYMENPNP